MKSLSIRTVFIAAIVTASLSSSHAMAAIDSSTEAKLVKICHALKSDSKIKLHRVIKQSRLGYRQIAKGLKCNGQSAMDFALLNQAQNTAGLLARKANIKHNGMIARR